MEFISTGVVLLLVVAVLRAEGNLGQNNPSVHGGYPACDPTVSQYSGYFDVSQPTNKHYFYWTFESRKNPATDPVILWMTGGPGCSSSLAVLLENGPCKVHQNGSLYNNPYSWNEVATVIYIDQPAGVGFSYADQSGYDVNETEVADDMYHFIQAFYVQFPRFRSRPLFVYGESYGGHFAPATAHRFLIGNQQKQGIPIPLTGLGIGNGWVDPLIQFQHYGDLAYNWCYVVKGTPCINQSAYETAKLALPTCIAMASRCSVQNESACVPAANYCGSTQTDAYYASGLNIYDIRKPCIGPLCYNMNAQIKFMNRLDVQQALGVHNPPMQWNVCSGSVAQRFTYDTQLSMDKKIPVLLAASIRVLIYAGDMDFICNWIGNKHWAVKLKWPGQQAFSQMVDKPWYLDEVEAGFFRTLPGNNTNMLFTFLQVHGSGHMVPMDQPQRALDMVRHFLNDQPFHYVPF